MLVILVIMLLLVLGSAFYSSCTVCIHIYSILLLWLLLLTILLFFVFAAAIAAVSVQIFFANVVASFVAYADFGADVFFMFLAAAFIKDNYFMVFTVYTICGPLSAAVLLLLLLPLS